MDTDRRKCATVRFDDRHRVASEVCERLLESRMFDKATVDKVFRVLLPAAIPAEARVSAERPESSCAFARNPERRA